MQPFYESVVQSQEFGVPITTTNFQLLTKKARMAKLVDAADSKSAVRKDVLVRFRFRAQDLIANDEVFYLRVSRI